METTQRLKAPADHTVHDVQLKDEIDHGVSVVEYHSRNRLDV
jgi:hypothetical protein